MHGEYVGRRAWERRNDEGEIRHHHAHVVRLPDGTTYSAVDGYVPPTGAPVRVVTWAPMFNALGRGPAAHGLVVALFVLYLLCALFLAGLLLSIEDRHWYDGAALVNHAQGRLDGRRSL